MSIKYNFKYVFLINFILGILLLGNTLQGQTETMSTGSYIINMGVTPQSVNNALRPYGMIYDLTKNYQVPIRWVINPSKGKDGVDFTFNGVSYRGGPFIIPAEFRTAAVNSRITHWQGQGVVGVTTNAPVEVPVYAVIGTAVRWTLDAENGDLAIPYLSNASIPSSAYGFKNPQSLNTCDDLYIMPHAEPTASTHSNLVTWNNTFRGSIWVGCKAGSELENNVGKFLSVNGLVPEKSHGDLSGGVTYTFDAEPVMQFFGTGAHLQSANGAEQIYYPNASGWRPTTHVGIYQMSPNVATNLRKAILAWGPGFGDTNRGWVCMHAGHSLVGKDKKGSGSADDNAIAAMRAFNNFSLLAAIKRTVYPVLTGVPNTISAGVGTPFSYTLTPAGGSFTTQWSSSCGGTFSPNATSANVTFTPPAGATSCMISVRVSDACGRVFFTSKLVTIQCTLNINRSITNVSCNGGNNGAIGMTITGASGPYSWNWSRVSPAGTGSGSGTTISNLTAGSYNVTVTSPAGCQSTFTSLVTQPNVLTATATAVNVNCFGQATGAVNLVVNGGTPAYTYSWSGPSGFTATTQNISNRPVGTYNVTVTDSKSCTATSTATITGPATPVAVILTSKTDVNCVGQNTGAINITASGGTPGYTYLWNTGATTEDRTGLAAGTYSVTVTDSKGCTAALTGIMINVVGNTNLTIAANNVSCVGGTNGSIQVTATGVAPFNINWTGPVSGNPAGNEIATSGGSYTLTNLSAGTYNVTVNDNNNCATTFMRTITAPSAVAATTAVTSFPCFGQTGGVSLTVTGGTPNYTYSWSGPSGFTATTQNISNRPAGTYNVTVTDANSCTTTATGTITGPSTAVSVALTSKTDVNCVGINTGAINITASGGTPTYTYLWNNGATTEDRTGLAPGIYSVVVTDSQGCTGALTGITIGVTQNTVLTIGTTNVSCAGGTNGNIQVTATGVAPFNINWTGPVSGNPGGNEIATSGGSYTLSSLSAGSYSVSVVDNNNCTSTFTRTLTAPATLVASAAVTSFPCFGQTGAVSLTVTGGTAGYTYSWTGPSGFTATTQNISNRPAGTYNVTVTDSQNCTATTTATITGPSAAVAIALDSKTNVTCNGNTNGAINITASGGTPGYTYAWSDGSTAQDRTGLGAGTYGLTVTDANGCTGTFSTIITQPQPLVLTIAKTDPTCPPGANPAINGNNGAINLTVSGGTSPYTYAWTTVGGAGLVPTAEDQTGLRIGTYTVVVTDANGCTANKSVTLTNISSLPATPASINN
jgi:SprB repeat